MMAMQASQGIVFRMPEDASEEARQAFRAGALFGLYALETRFDAMAEADRRHLHNLVDEEQFHEVIHTGQGARAHQHDRRQLAETYRAIEATPPDELIGQATAAADEVEVGIAAGRKGIMIGPEPECIEAEVIGYEHGRLEDAETDDEEDLTRLLVRGMSIDDCETVRERVVSIQVLPDRTGRSV